MARLNRTERTQYYTENILPMVREQYEQDGRIDVPARREAWNEMIDMMERDGQITTKQAHEDAGLPNRFEPRR